MFEQKISKVKQVGEVFGFLFSYAIFSTIVSFVFSFRLNVAFLIPLGIVAVSLIFKKLFS